MEENYEIIARREYRGHGKTLDEALTEAATEAIGDGNRPGTTLEVVRWQVVVNNPRVSDHFIVIS